MSSFLVVSDPAAAKHVLRATDNPKQPIYGKGLVAEARARVRVCAFACVFFRAEWLRMHGHAARSNNQTGNAGSNDTCLIKQISFSIKRINRMPPPGL